MLRDFELGRNVTCEESTVCMRINYYAFAMQQCQQRLSVHQFICSSRHILLPRWTWLICILLCVHVPVIYLGCVAPKGFLPEQMKVENRGNQQTQVQLEDGVDDGGGDDVFLAVLLCSLAVLDPSVGHTIDVLSPFISVLLSFWLTLPRGVLSTYWCCTSKLSTKLTSVVTVEGICNLDGGGVFWHHHGGECQSVSRLGLLIGNRWMSRLWEQILPAVLECANCSRHATVGAALSETITTETITTVSLSTVPRLSLQSCCLRVGKRTPGGRRAVWLTGLTRRAFAQSNDAAFRWLSLLWAAGGSGAPKKTAENTVKHRDGGIGSVVANQCDGG